MSQLVTVLERTNHQLEALRARVQRAVWVDTLGLLCLRFFVFAAVTFVADYSFELELPVRALLLFGLLAALAETVRRRALVPLRTELSRDELALAFERGGKLEERLISAVQFAQQGDRATATNISPAMVAAVIDEAESRSSTLSITDAIDPKVEQRGYRRMAGLFIVLTLAFAVFPGPSSTWARRNLALSGELWPRETNLRFVDVPPDGLRIGPGTDLRLTIEVDGVVPDEVSVTAESTDGRRSETRAALVTDRRFRVVLEDLRDSVTVRARGGDGSSDELRIEVVAAPLLLDLEWTAQLPPYLQNSIETVDRTEDPTRRSQVLQVVRGGTASLRVRADKPLRRIELRRTTRGDTQANEARKFTAEANSAEAALSLTPGSDAVFELHVEDSDGIDLQVPPRLSLQVIEDEPPAIESRTPGVGTMLVANARIPVRVSATDDHGLFSLIASASVRRADDGLSSESEPIDLTEAVRDVGDLPNRPTSLERDLVCDLDRLPADTLQVGDRLRLWFAATDARGSEGRGNSEPSIFRIVTRDELLEDLGRRQREVRRDVEEVLLDLIELRAELDSTGDASDELDRSGRPRDFAERLGNAADRFDAVLAELGNNRLLEDRDLDRLRSAVIEALRGVISGPLPRAAQALEQPLDSDTAKAELDRTAEELRRVLSQLDRAEGLPRLVELLKGLLDTTERVEAAIDEARSSQAADDIFGPGSGDNRNDGGRDRDR